MKQSLNGSLTAPLCLWCSTSSTTSWSTCTQPYSLSSCSRSPTDTIVYRRQRRRRRLKERLSRRDVQRGRRKDKDNRTKAARVSYSLPKNQWVEQGDYQQEKRVPSSTETQPNLPTTHDNLMKFQWLMHRTASHQKWTIDSTCPWIAERQEARYKTQLTS